MDESEFGKALAQRKLTFVGDPGHWFDAVNSYK